MLLDFREKGKLIVRKEATDRTYGRNESTFLYHVKKALIRHGYDCTKKLAYKDGNLVDDSMYYIRARKGQWSVYDSLHAVRFVSHVFDKEGEVVLCVDESVKGTFYATDC